MIYRFLLLSDEKESFERVIEIDSKATFLDFHKIILESVNYNESELTSFHICNSEWEKEQEIMLLDMSSESTEDIFLMENTKLEEFVEDEGQRLIFVFDMLTERSFFIELTQLSSGSIVGKAKCILSSGEPPVQSIDFEESLDSIMGNKHRKSIFDGVFDEDDIFDQEEYDIDDFSDMNY
ncbi:MAG: hypothetical protein CSA89_00175 [Bacteroidales bacterium]|nr:MAG: hypothetical protein CSA89_00175 [Bacteroidales bacterium]